MPRILLLVVLLIVYASLYPWQFHARQIPGNPLWILLHSWPWHFDRFIAKDIGVNILLYMPLGFFGFLSFRRIALPIVMGLALSSSLEMVQLYDAQRVCSALDVTLNTLGAAAGVALAVLAQRRILPGVNWMPRPSRALFLIYVWAGYLMFPLFPEFSRTLLAGKLRALTLPESVPTLVAFAEWLALAKMVEALVGASSAWAVLLWMLLLAIGKLLIVSRTVTSSELAGAAVALLLWAVWLRRRTWPAAALFLATLLISGLAPFHWLNEPQSFSWVPFRAFLLTDWQVGSVVFLQKTFLYGAAIWLLCEAGFRLWTAAVATAGLLAIIEAAQAYLPGRVAESTDPLMALGLALILSAWPGAVGRDKHLEYRAVLE